MKVFEQYLRTYNCIAELATDIVCHGVGLSNIFSFGDTVITYT